MDPAQTELPHKAVLSAAHKTTAHDPAGKLWFLI